ncbi:MAG: hypothetical protein K2I80_07570 [Ruminococcus sp.]|nr:hypothetical protein [Ruminococcus sp.]
MRKTRFFIMAFLLVGIMFILSGCAYYNDHFDFEFNGEYMADKYVDLLIPLEETDEFYTDYNCNIEGNIEIPKNSEIVNYNKDGFRSMIMHIKGSRLYISITDSEHYPASHEKYNGTPSEIRQCVNVPYYEGISDTYNTNMFLKFCNKYKKCCVAVFDKDGNIIQISKKIPLVSLGNFYLQDISYNVEQNRIKPSYIMSKEILVFIDMVWLFSLIGTIGCIITFIVYKINNNPLDRTYRGYIIASSLFNVPNAILIILILYCEKASVFINLTAFFTDIFHTLLQLGIIAVIGPIINICVLVHFIRLEKKLHSKKYLE